MSTTLPRWFLPAALLACAAPQAITTAYAKDDPVVAHGGRMLDIRGGRIELVHDDLANTLTLYATKSDGTLLDLKQAPQLVVTTEAGPAMIRTSRDVAFEALAGTPGAWRALCPRHDGWSAPSISVRVIVDGRSEVLALTETPVTRRGVLVFGKDALRLEVTCDDAKGVITFRALTAKDAETLGTSTPEVVVAREGKEKTYATTRDAADKRTYILADTTPLRDLAEAFVRVQIAGQPEDARLVLSTDADRGIHGGTVVSLDKRVDGSLAGAKDARRLEVLHDALNGTLTVYTIADATAWSLLEAPSVVLSTPTGPKTLPTVAVSDVDGMWRVTAPELKREHIEGTLRVRIGDTPQELTLPRMPTLRASAAYGNR